MALLDQDLIGPVQILAVLLIRWFGGDPLLVRFWSAGGAGSALLAAAEGWTATEPALSLSHMSLSVSLSSFPLSGVSIICIIVN